MFDLEEVMRLVHPSDETSADWVCVPSIIFAAPINGAQP